MWLPTPIYERIPQFWLLLGLLFMSSGTYLGFEYSVSFLYFGAGLICIIWSLCIFTMRLRARSKQRRYPILDLDRKPEESDEAKAPAVTGDATPAA